MRISYWSSDVCSSDLAADGADRHAVAVEVAGGVAGGERGFAEHVVGIAIVGVFTLARALECVFDRPSHHELVAHDAHRLAHRKADHRLTGKADQHGREPWRESVSRCA